MNEKPTTRDDYRRRIMIVEEYITSHLDEEIDLCRLAEIANFSPFHFHRITKAFLGEPIGAYITRMRIETAARLLNYSDCNVADIAIRVGFGEPSSFSRAFRKAFGVSPNQYRKTKKIKIMKTPETKSHVTLPTPRIERIEPKQTLYFRTTGVYGSADFYNLTVRLEQKATAEGLFSSDCEFLSVYLDDNRVTDMDKLRTDVCLSFKGNSTPSDGISVGHIDGGKYAIFDYVGSYEYLGEIYDKIFGEWLPDSGCLLDERPCFEKYCNNPMATAPANLRTEIYIPIK